MEILRALDDGDVDDLDELFSDSDEEMPSDLEPEPEQDPPQPPARHKKVALKNRAVQSIDTALDPTNYDEWKLPDEVKQHTVVFEKKTRNNPEKTLTWKNKPSTQRGRQNMANILTGTPGVNRRVQNLTSPVDAWKCMFTDDMLDMVVEHTNKKIQAFRAGLDPSVLSNNKMTYLHETDNVEVTAFIGLIYARGMLGQSHHNRNLLFNDRIGHPIFGATMSKNRFTFLLSKVSFDDESTRRDRWTQDRFAAFRELHILFNRNCASAITPDDFITIDETLYPMRTQISFKQYNRNKPAKYGLLFKSINAARYPYTFFSHPYSGKPTGEPTEHYMNGTDETVQYMIRGQQQHSDLRGRNLSVDRFYTSVPLAEWLFQHGITIVGTLQANRRGIPPAVKETAGRAEFSYQVHWSTTNRNLSLHSYVVKTKSTGPRNVLLLTTMKPILGVTKDDGKCKPAIYKLYDFTKGGTDIVDQRSQIYTCKAKSHRWTLVAFYYLLDTCRINSSTLAAMNEGMNPRLKDSFEFGWGLAEDLTRPFIQQRPVRGLTSPVMKKRRTILQEPEPRPEVVVAHAAEGERQRCRVCIEQSKGDGYKQKKKNLAKMRTKCQQCGNTTCKEHSVIICISCHQE